MALWTPAILNSSVLVAWYKADTLALVDGQIVSQWNDSSGNGHHLKQVFGAQYCPLYRTGGPNGLPYVEFSVINPQGHNLTTHYSSTFADVPQPFYMAMLCRPRVVPTVATEYWIVPDGQSAIFMGMNAADPTTFLWAGAADALHIADSPAWKLRAGLVSGAASELRLDGGAPSSGLNIGSQGFLSSGLSLATTSSIGSGSNIDILEVIVTTDVSSDTMRKIEGYADWRAGLQANLPANHVFKSAPPEGPSLIQASDGIATALGESALGWPILPIDLVEADLETEQ